MYKPIYLFLSIVVFTSCKCNISGKAKILLQIIMSEVSLAIILASIDYVEFNTDSLFKIWSFDLPFLIVVVILNCRIWILTWIRKETSKKQKREKW